MSIKRLHPGPRMSQAVIHGDTVYLAGQVGNPGRGMAEQAQEALAAVDSLLAEAGSSKSKILSVTVWLADMGDFATMNKVYEAWVDKDNPPAAPPARPAWPPPTTASNSSSPRRCKRPRKMDSPDPHGPGLFDGPSPSSPVGQKT